MHEEFNIHYILSCNPMEDLLKLFGGNYEKAYSMYRIENMPSSKALF